jgi:hypothetical protein
MLAGGLSDLSQRTTASVALGRAAAAAPSAAVVIIYQDGAL